MRGGLHAPAALDTCSRNDNLRHHATLKALHAINPSFHPYHRPRPPTQTPHPNAQPTQPPTPQVEYAIQDMGYLRFYLAPKIEDEDMEGEDEAP